MHDKYPFTTATSGIWDVRVCVHRLVQKDKFNNCVISSLFFNFPPAYAMSY